MSNVIFKGGGRIVSMGTPSTQEPDVFVQMNTLRLGQALLDDNITVYNATWKIYIQREVLKHVIRDLTVIFNDSSVAWKTKVGYGTIEFMLDSELDLGIPAKSFLIKVVGLSSTTVVKIILMFHAHYTWNYLLMLIDKLKLLLLVLLILLVWLI